jgi:TPP-dependent pyruvate/acetoin dehydrogenase alpha subunit
VAPYDFARETVDGNDLLAVWSAFSGFLARARAGEGPFLLECLTHRLSGHYVGDPAAYREALAADEWRALDPIVRLRERLVADGTLDEARADAIAAAAVAEVQAAEAFGRESAYPPADLTQELAYV